MDRALRLPKRLHALPSQPAGAWLGLVIVVETTGADLRGTEVIELARR